MTGSIRTRDLSKRGCPRDKSALFLVSVKIGKEGCPDVSYN